MADNNSKQKNWLEEFLTSSKAFVTNVFIFETLDPRRLERFVEKLSDEWIGEAKDKPLGRLQLLEFNEQTKSLYDVGASPKKPTLLTPTGPMDQYLNKALNEQPTLLIIKWITSEDEAKRIGGFLLEWAKNRNIRQMKSKVCVFTFSSYYFSEVLRRWARSITIPTSTEEEIREILSEVALGFRKEDLVKGWKDGWDNITQETVENLRGLTLEDAYVATKLSLWEHKSYYPPVFAETKIKILLDYGIRYVKPSYGFEKVAGMTKLKQTLINRFIQPIKDPNFARKYDLSPARGILLYGPPGTGKTYVAKALAKEIGMAMLEIDPSDFLRGIVGESERRTRQIIEIIESLAPVAVLMDEFDVLTLRRELHSITDSGVKRNIQQILLTWLSDENRKSFVIGGTNLAEQIDDAFLRPGRLDDTLLILPPNKDARVECFKIHTANAPLGFKVDQFVDLAEKTKYWTPAEIKKLIDKAKAIAMEEKAEKVQLKHFDAAFEKSKPNIEERKAQIEEYVKAYKNLLNSDKEFMRDTLQSLMESEKEQDQDVADLFRYV